MNASMQLHKDDKIQIHCAQSIKTYPVIEKNYEIEFVGKEKCEVFFLALIGFTNGSRNLEHPFKSFRLFQLRRQNELCRNRHSFSQIY